MNGSLNEPFKGGVDDESARRAYAEGYMPLRRIVLLLLFLFGAVFAVVVIPEVMYGNERTSLREVSSIEQRDREVLFRELFLQDKLSQRNLTSDYTFWDDMVEFANGKRSEQWAADNLNSGLMSFHVSGIWVTNRTGALRYGITGASEGEVARSTQLPIPFEVIRTSAAKDKLAEFYRRINGTTYVVMTAGVVPTTDDMRQTEPQGYFLTLTPIDDEFVQQLGSSTGTTVLLVPPETVEDPTGLIDEATGTYVFWQPLNDENGERVGAFRVERSSETMATLASQVAHNRSSNRIAFTALWILLAIVVSLLDRARVRANVHSEELRRDIEKQKKSEDELRARTEELEKTNKMMIGRELRMLELKKKLEEEENAPKQ